MFMPVNKDKLSEEEQIFLKNIGFKIQFLRKKVGLSQAELAERSGLSDSTISHLESTSVYTVSTISLHRIARALGVLQNHCSILISSETQKKHRTYRCFFSAF